MKTACECPSVTMELPYCTFTSCTCTCTSTCMQLWQFVTTILKVLKIQKILQDSPQAKGEKATNNINDND